MRLWTPTRKQHFRLRTNGSDRRRTVREQIERTFGGPTISSRAPASSTLAFISAPRQNASELIVFCFGSRRRPPARPPSFRSPAQSMPISPRSVPRSPFTTRAANRRPRGRGRVAESCPSNRIRRSGVHRAARGLHRCVRVLRNRRRVSTPFEPRSSRVGVRGQLPLGRRQRFRRRRVRSRDQNGETWRLRLVALNMLGFVTFGTIALALRETRKTVEVTPGAWHATAKEIRFAHSVAFGLGVLISPAGEGFGSLDVASLDEEVTKGAACVASVDDDHRSQFGDR